jgi:hypothetical protein
MLNKMFSEVLRWNVMFGVPVPDDNILGMGKLLQEEFNEFVNAENDEERADALVDIVVVTLGICARTLNQPQSAKGIIQRAGGINRVNLDIMVFYGVMDSINSGLEIGRACSELLEIVFIECDRRKIDIEAVFRKVMDANWKKFWTEEEAKKAPQGYIVEKVGGIVVRNEFGKVMKPPTFEHPKVLAASEVLPKPKPAGFKKP